MDNGFIIDIPKYNSNTYLYDVPILINEQKQTISCYRILNSTPLIYSEEPGYFYISMDSKYLFFKDTIMFNDYLKNIQFSISNPSKTNQDILDINNDPVQKYTYIVLSTLEETMCINLALEDKSSDKSNQLKTINKYVTHDCLVKNITNNSYTNVSNEPDSLYERLTGLFTPNASNNNHDHITIVDIHQYNKFYVYGLTTLNMFLIIIIVIILLLLTNDSTPNKNRSTKTFDK